MQDFATTVCRPCQLPPLTPWPTTLTFATTLPPTTAWIATSNICLGAMSPCQRQLGPWNILKCLEIGKVKIVMKLGGLGWDSGFKHFDPWNLFIGYSCTYSMQICLDCCCELGVYMPPMVSCSAVFHQNIYASIWQVAAIWKWCTSTCPKSRLPRLYLCGSYAYSPLYDIH